MMHFLERTQAGIVKQEVCVDAKTMETRVLFNFNEVQGLSQFVNHNEPVYCYNIFPLLQSSSSQCTLARVSLNTWLLASPENFSKFFSS
jgi:hypothetical protein